MNSKIKNIIIFIVIFGAIAAVYVFFFKKPEVPALVSTSGEPVQSTVTSSTEVGQEFLSLLLNIRNIKLDDSVFKKAGFKILQDYTITLTPEGNEGRANPFAPIGTDSSAGVPEESANEAGPVINTGS